MYFFDLGLVPAPFVLVGDHPWTCDSLFTLFERIVMLLL